MRKAVHSPCDLNHAPRKRPPHMGGLLLGQLALNPFSGVRRTSLSGQAALSDHSRCGSCLPRRCSITRTVFFDAWHSIVLRPLPAQLTALCHIVVKTGTTKRILPHAVTQRFEISSSGALVLPTEGSTKPVTVTVTNAGIAVVEQFELRMR
jgi:hypothetical protein